ncbi:MAG: hypothetical protein CL840_18180 [Crocinitomicaceae bacterium]|nr:hypothetical protein [Crocinitomicaceae bacterium]|tara:strand:- start:5800 stop:6285 length:486 start_codon:yes stop_codon:yes gene_type:complete
MAIKMKLFKTILGIVIVGLMVIIGGWLILIGYFTYVYPPIEEYEYEGLEIQLIENLNLIQSTYEYQFGLKDTTGEYPNNYSVHFSILDSDSCSYQLAYSMKFQESIEISLIGVFDLKNNKGGYSNSDDKTIDILQHKFEEGLLKQILNPPRPMPKRKNSHH